MAEYRVTFGCRYSHEHHPAFIAGRLDFEPSPNGWLVVVADDEPAARAAANALLDGAWAFIYGPEEDLRSFLFPLGEIARLDTTKEKLNANI